MDHTTSIILAFLLYAITAALVVFFSKKLGDYVDLLDKKTDVSGAFLGGILLAAVTSLPELFTSLTAVLLPPSFDNQLVMGNVLGSDIFNITIFAIVFLFFFNKLAKAKVNKIHFLTLGIALSMYVLAVIGSFVFDSLGWLMGWVNPISILVLALYAFSVIKTPKEEEADEGEVDSKLTVKQIIVLFALFSILLIGASIAMTYLVEWISSLTHMGTTFAGALFLGVATSLPELTATITLCKKGNFNAAYGDLIGSCVFNFFILVFADVMSFMVRNSAGEWVGIYSMNQSTFLLLICGGFTIIVFGISLFLQLKKLVKSTVGFRILYITFAILLLGSYVAFLALSNVDLHITFAPYIAG